MFQTILITVFLSVRLVQSDAQIILLSKLNHPVIFGLCLFLSNINIYRYLPLMSSLLNSSFYSRCRFTLETLDYYF